MMRLLDESDFAFLASQPGYQASIERRLRAERKAVFRGYLWRLVRDFNQLVSIAKLMVVFSEEDRTEFAKSLWRQQVTFYFAVCALGSSGWHFIQWCWAPGISRVRWGR